MSNTRDGAWQVEVPADELFALRDWLAAEDSLRGLVSPLRPRPKPGEMGGVVDVLTVALGSGGAGVVLVRALCTWLVQRRADVAVTITAPDGTHVQVDAKRAADPETIIREAGVLAGREDADSTEK